MALLVSMYLSGGETLEFPVPRSSGLHRIKWENSEMPAKDLRPFLVKSAQEKMVKQPRFHTEEIVRQSGIYRVRHRKHRLPHEVTLLRDQHFPRCAQCADAVIFELVRRMAEEAEGTSSRVCLYEVPVVEDDESAKSG